VDVFAPLICLALDPVSVEVFEDTVEIFGGLGESVPLLRVVFQELLILIFLCILIVNAEK